jgi:hypothetical protein
VDVVAATFEWQIVSPSATYGTHPSPCPETFVGDDFVCAAGGWQIARVADDCGVITCPSGS